MKYIKDFFFLNLENYENIAFPFPIGIFLTVFTLALCIMSFVVNYYKRHTTYMLKQLLRHKAFDASVAKTLSELNLKDSFPVKLALSGSGQLTYLVKRAGFVRPTYEEYVENSKIKGFKDEKINFQEAKFYLDIEKIDRAKRTVERARTDWYRPVIISVVLIAILVALVFLLPMLLDFLNKSL